MSYQFIWYNDSGKDILADLYSDLEIGQVTSAAPEPATEQGEDRADAANEEEEEETIGLDKSDVEITNFLEQTPDSGEFVQFF